MKIIKTGKKDTLRTRCIHCDAELEITSKDCEVSCSTISFKCPCCNYFSYLSYSEITEDFKFYLGISKLDSKNNIIEKF